MPGAAVTSNSQTITGINYKALVTAVGSGCSVSVNGGVYRNGNDTNNPIIIRNNDIVTLQIRTIQNGDRFDFNRSYNVNVRIGKRDAINMIKSFYIKFPQYRWVTFRDMRGLSEREFANALKESCLAVWVDEVSSYGTFPLEAMKSGVPVLGVVPNMVPSWMSEDNGIWINNKVQIVDFVADFIQNWLEDNINPNMSDEMLKTIENQSTQEEFNKVAVSLFEGYITKRVESFEEQLSKLQTIE